MGSWTKIKPWFCSQLLVLEQGASCPCSLDFPIECSFVDGKLREGKIVSGLYHVPYIVDPTAQFTSEMQWFPWTQVPQSKCTEFNSCHRSIGPPFLNGPKRKKGGREGRRRRGRGERRRRRKRGREGGRNRGGAWTIKVQTPTHPAFPYIKPTPSGLLAKHLKTHLHLRIFTLRNILTWKSPGRLATSPCDKCRH